MSLIARIILSLMLVAGWVPAWAAGAVLQNVGIDHAQGNTRVIFHFAGGDPAFHDFALGDPPRAVLDMHATRNGWAGHALSDRAVAHIRLARHKNGTLRAVLDLHPGAHLAGVSRQGNTLVMRLTGGHATAQSAADSVAHDRQAAPASATARQTSYHAGRRQGPIVVVIDPGHGGHDPGTRGPHGLAEKTVTLAIARRVAQRLKHTPHVHPVLTRANDSYISLPRRVAIAQQHHADLFVSIHENAYPHDPRVRGGSCYVLSKHGASDAEAAQLARFENNADPEVAGVHFASNNRTLNTILTQLFQNNSIGAADDLAGDIIARFARIEPIYHHVPLRANFAVLRDPMIPSVLCETAFLSNPKQAHKLRGAHFRNQLADAIYNGIMHYLRHNPPMKALPNRRDVYVVKRGDTLSTIAAAHHIPAQRLMAINDLRRPSLNVGQRLIVPHDPRPAGKSSASAAGGTVAYKVRPGDTLSQIAARFGASTQRLERLNGLSGPAIRSGEVLHVPTRSADSS